MENIYLTGMPGCGHNDLAMGIANKSGLEFIDTDKLAVEMARENGLEEAIFKNRDMNALRSMEKMALKHIAKKDDCIVATGTGIILDSENVDIMINSGKIVFVDVSIETLKNRIDTSSRPLVADIGSAIEKLYFNRYDKYKSNSTHIFNNDGEIALNILKFVEEFTNN